MKQVLINRGRPMVEEVPPPHLEPGTILVRVDHSCISVGTEMTAIKTSGQSLWKRAIKEPRSVEKVLGMVSRQGLGRTRSLVKGVLSAGSPVGYSAAGVVLEVAADIGDLRPGNRVACAGAQCAHHAEIIRVPRNLAVLVPQGVDFAAASTVALGAIALQGVRRAQPTLGELFVVIGLGVLGQLTAQILRANGCRVIGTDLDHERIRLARELGMHTGIYPEETDVLEFVQRLTHGIGADGVIITAATPSHGVVSTAFRFCRKKGRVVLVGDVGLHLNRADFYDKELDFFISTSYGPGRYDNDYEEKGLDYPVGYVRWTENRNMAEYMRLLAEDRIKVGPLIAATYPVDEAASAYASLGNGAQKPLMVLLSYPYAKEAGPPLRVVPNPISQAAGPGKIRMAVIGAGGFAKVMHLPNLKALSNLFHLRAIVSRTGPNATAVAKQFGANFSTTDYQQVLDDPDVEAVLIVTRHNLHASMVLQALRAGKHVLVEKPLCLRQEELDSIQDFYHLNLEAQNVESPILMTGFNRRFSRFAHRIHELTDGRTGPMILNYRLNAGYIPLDHWVHMAEGGGRNLGEACHIYDLFTYFTGSKVTAVSAHAIDPSTGYYAHTDNFVATLSFEDGSVGSLTYTALGAKEYPKEQLEVFVDGKLLVLNDYKRLTLIGTKAKGVESKVADKGHKEELKTFGYAIQQGGDWPIPLWQQVQATQIAFQVEAQIGSERNLT